MLRSIFVLSAVTWLAIVAPSQAAIITYTDRSLFESAAGPVSIIDFEANDPGPNAYNFHVTSHSVGGVTFTQPDGRLFVFGESWYPTLGLTSAYLNQNCCAPAGITATFSSNMYAVGMELGIQNNWTGTPVNPNDIVMTLSTGDVLTFTAPFLYNTPNTLQFFGFTSDAPITSIHFANAAEGIAIDDFTFSAQPGTSVPEPATLAMFALGVAGLGWKHRRRRLITSA